MQWDYGDGPEVAVGATSLFCAWLAWSRFRVVIAVVGPNDAERGDGPGSGAGRFGGAPTYALTDNERTVSIDHVCGIAVRNPKIVAASPVTTG